MQRSGVALFIFAVALLTGCGASDSGRGAASTIPNAAALLPTGTDHCVKGAFCFGFSNATNDEMLVFTNGTHCMGTTPQPMVLRPHAKDGWIDWPVRTATSAFCPRGTFYIKALDKVTGKALDVEYSYTSSWRALFSAANQNVFRFCFFRQTRTRLKFDTRLIDIRSQKC